MTPVQAPANSATLLAFDTATECLAVALGTPRGDFLRHLPGGAAASAALLPAVRGLLAEAGREQREIDAIAFGRGPGAFTGLRTSCAVAQGLALGLGLPVLPIDSLLIVAEDARMQYGRDGQRFEVGVAADARMGEIYAARYVWLAGDWTVLEPAALHGLEALSLRWGRARPPVVAGSALALAGAALDGPGVQRVEAEQDRAAALLALARQAWAGGRGVDAAEALPTYVRDKVALTTAERSARAEAAA